MEKRLCRRTGGQFVAWTRYAARLVLVLALAGFLRTAKGQDTVADTVHNLAASGPGSIRAVGEPEVCLFCHASHVVGASSPLWNRETPVSNYKIYESSTLNARPGQPTGSSKLCLSCHDGTIALGSVLTRREQIRMQGGDFVPAGLANLGTDLSDDHPVSFSYSSGLAAADRQLVSPRGVSTKTQVDDSGQLQCTSCHDPHHNRYGNFLVVDPDSGALCMSCHAMDGWSSSTHRSSNASVASSKRGGWPRKSVSANACRSCHRSHSAGGRHRLLIYEAEEDNCLVCHDGSVARTNVRAELDKLSGHDPRLYQGEHDPVEGVVTKGRHVECVDCHNPHAVRSASGKSGFAPIGPTTMNVPGVRAGGGVVANATNEYEICFRCHGDSPMTTSSKAVARQAQQHNVRLKFSPTNPSFHPVVSRVTGSETVSLVPEIARGSLIRCTDCHNNDSGPRAGGSGPDGPHGSRHEFLLERNYTTRDDTVESQVAYGLCYKCHRRASILSDESFPLHRKHIVEERTPCSACHDPHGISSTQAFGSDFTHLMNFDARIVRPGGKSKRVEFRDRGRRSGSCTLMCHGVDHDDLGYGAAEVLAPNASGSKRPIRRR